MIVPHHKGGIKRSEAKNVQIFGKQKPQTAKNYMCRCCLNAAATGEICWGSVDT